MSTVKYNIKPKKYSDGIKLAGYLEKEAKKLEKGGVYFFKDTFDKVMKDLGYTHQITTYADSENYNYNIVNGERVGQMRFLDTLEDFLYRKANGIEWWQ